MFSETACALSCIVIWCFGLGKAQGEGRGRGACETWKVLSMFFQKCLNSNITADNSVSLSLENKSLNKLVLIFLLKCYNKAAYPLNLP